MAWGFLAKAIFNIQNKAPSRTDFPQFAHRSHFLADEKGGE
ncbi:MAG: hypothetical protein JWQ89_4361 [Devosia sp.]|nr:hypothetical protein [Devosia sp.]MDB5542634.1 hypothetical protein [Devosia sp.]